MTNDARIAVESRAPMRAAALPPPGTKYTTAASARTIAMLRSVAVDTAQRVRGGGLARGRRLGGGGFGRCDGPLGLGDDRLGQRRDVVARLGRESVADAEVRVDVPPPRRRLLELLAQLADEHVDRPVAARHRVSPHALVDLLALEHATLGRGEQLDQLELAPREIDGHLADVRLEAIGADLDLAGADRRALLARLGPASPAHDGLHAREQLLGVAGLRQPVVGAQPQAPHALGDRRLPGADDHAEPGQRRAQLLEVVPGLRPEDREVDDDRVQPHGDAHVGRAGAGEHAVPPAEPLEALSEHLEEPRVGVEHGDAQLRAAEGGSRAELPAGGGDPFRHVRAQSSGRRGGLACRKAPVHRFNTCAQRRNPRPATKAPAKSASRTKPPASSHQSADPAAALRTAAIPTATKIPIGSAHVSPRTSLRSVRITPPPRSTPAARRPRPRGPAPPPATRAARPRAQAGAPHRPGASPRRAPPRRRTSRTSSARARRRTSARSPAAAATAGAARRRARARARPPPRRPPAPARARPAARRGP